MLAGVEVMQLALPQTRREALEELLILEQLAKKHVQDDGPARLRASIPAKFYPLLQPARYKGAKGGRGSAKSQTMGRLLLGKAVDFHKATGKGLRWACIREVQDTIKDSVKQLLTRLINEFQLDLQGFVVMASEIITPGGGVIVFKGMQNSTAPNIKSLEGFHGAWVEEADTLSAASMEVLSPTFREDDAELWFTWNPRKPTDPVDKLFNPAFIPEDAILVEANWNDNQHFPEVLRKDMERDYRMDAELASHIWGGKYKRLSQATVFKNVKAVVFDTPDDAAFLFGGDFGFAVDPTVLARCFIPHPRQVADFASRGIVKAPDSRVLCLDAVAYQVGCEIDDTPALFDNIDPARPKMARAWQIIADSARPETISYLQRHGYPRVEPARKGTGSVEEGVTFLQGYEILIHPRAAQAVDEFIDYAYRVHPLTGEVLPQLADKKNHVIDSVRYAVEKVRRPTGWVNW